MLGLLRQCDETRKGGRIGSDGGPDRRRYGLSVSVLSVCDSCTGTIVSQENSCCEIDHDMHVRMLFSLP